MRAQNNSVPRIHVCIIELCMSNLIPDLYILLLHMSHAPYVPVSCSFAHVK